MHFGPAAREMYVIYLNLLRLNFILQSEEKKKI